MGTSTHNKGQSGKTPLIPSWLKESNEYDNNEDQETQVDLTYIIGPADRFKEPRSDFTRYINSQGRNGESARKGISHYIKQSLGGSYNATLRMGTARNSSAKLLEIANRFANNGASGVEKFLSLSDLAKRQARDVFIEIADFICPDGGPLDEGIARDAYITALEQSPDLAEIKFEDMEPEQIMILLKRSMTESVIKRITNDIGNQIISLPENCNMAEALIAQIRDYIRGSIDNAMAKININDQMGKTDAIEVIDTVYRDAFDIMLKVGDIE